MGIIFLSALSISGQTRGAIHPVSTIIEQPDAPIKITKYDAAYQEGVRYSREGIAHTVSYMNTSRRKIVAVQLGLVSFDVWNEFLDRTNGVSMADLEPYGEDTGFWVATASADFQFLTGVVYVAKVRFEEGEIWSVDLEEIAKELREIEEGFDVSKLLETTEK